MTPLRKVASRIYHMAPRESASTKAEADFCDKIESILQRVVEEACCHECGIMGSLDVRHGICRIKEARSAGKAEGLELGAKVAESAPFNWTNSDELRAKMAAAIRGLKV